METGGRSPLATKVGIGAFRKLGGRWEAHRNGMGTFYYTGELGGHTYEVMSYAHYAPRWDGDDGDGAFTVLWHTTRDGKPWGYATLYPVEQIQEAQDEPT